MPYIGNSHIAGDHTNNFKVLDDISSFTATFDGSATSVVDTTNNTIRVVEHRFIQGQRVTYTNGSGGNIGGLTTGTAYFVIFDTANTIKLATNASNAASSTAINLSAVGTGTSHTLNVAFDGVNKKFKLSHSSGTDARLNNASQINIAINNVVQRPNLDPNNFTDGFALEDNHKIVFQTAPTSQDIFWGSIIANTLTTFDISDHKIDTFTGDGSTTEFTLSHTPANNESLMVTINGVLQHPSNASTPRAYTLIASIIQFTAAPGVGDEIQVRHLGFAGATTADVSGFYGRTGNVALTANDHITTGDITARNFKATGITTFSGAVSLGAITATTGTFSGDVSIGGTLTYEDVTNIDSVGLVTARDGIDCNGDIDVDGHTNLDNVSVSGITTFSGIIDVVNTPASIRVAQDIQHKGDADTKITFPANDTISFDTAGDERLRVNSSGKLLIGSATLRNIGGASANSHIQLEGLTANTSSVALINNQANTNSPVLSFGKTRGTSTGAVTTVADGDNLGSIKFCGADGTDIENSTANIKAIVNGTVAGNQIPTDLVFETSPTGSSGKTERLRIDSSGNVGINQNNPSAYGKFVVNGTGNVMSLRASSGAGSLAFFEGGTGRFYIKTLNGSDGLSFVDGDNTSERLRIDSSGNVDIATGQLTISNDIKSSDDDFYVYSYKGGSDGQVRSGIQYDGNSQRLRFFTGTNERVRIISGGNVGIGTDNPQCLLDISKDISGGVNYVDIRNHHATGGAALRVKTQGTYASPTYQGILGASDAGGTIRVGAVSNHPLLLLVNNQEKLRINTSGDMGLGTSTIENFGGGHVTFEVAGSTTSQGGVFKTATSDSAGSGSSGTEMIMFTDNTKGAINVVSSDPLTFSTANTERLRILSGGGITVQQGNNHYPTTFIGGSTGGRNYLTVRAGNTTSGHYSGFNIQDSSANHLWQFGVQHTTDDLDIFGNSAGGNLRFWTKASGAGSSTIKMQLTHDGNLDVPTGTISDTKGEIRKIILKANSTNNYNLISSDAGKAIHSSADVVVPNAIFSAGDAITLINSSSSNMSIVQGTNVTMYNSADGSSGNRTLSGKGMATLYWIDSSTCYISGAGLS